MNDRVREALGDTFYEEFMVSAFNILNFCCHDCQLYCQKTNYFIQFLHLAVHRMKLKRQKNTDQIIINHKGTRMVKDGEN